MTGQPKIKRWGVLFCFAMAAGLSQMLWLNFAPILSLVEKMFGVTEARASLLLLVFPLTYVLLSVHAGSLTDRKGYRTSLLFGTLTMAIFACLRIYLGSFWVLLIGQIGISIAQPYVVNAISKLVLDWFEREHEALATGLGTMGMFIGMALGMALTPPMVSAWGLQNTMIVFAIVSWAVFASCYYFVTPNSSNIGLIHIQTRFSEDFKKLVQNPELLWLFFISFLGLGYFNGLTTWMEPILAPNGFDSEKAGIIGGVLILGGIFGSVIIPGLSDQLKKRKPILISCLLISGASVYPLVKSSSYGTVLFLAALQGFFFLPAYALLLEMCSELAGAAMVGSATGILMLTGNAGGVVVILAMEWIKGESPTFDRAIILLMILMLIAIATAIRIRETFSLRTSRELTD